MPEVSATDAARNFADLLDAVEHRGERFTIVRRGRAVAQIEPVMSGRGADVKSMLRRHRADLVIYFTDGHGPAPEDAPQVLVIWCLTPGGKAPTPWGMVVRMK